MGMIYGSIPLGQNLTENASMRAPIDDIMSYPVAYTTQDWGQLAAPVFHTDFFASLLKITTLDLPIFGGPNDPAQILRWIFLGPVIACIVVAVVLGIISIFSKVLT